ncbi:MAG: hypothetical protein MNPFHGCM_01305 [Gemmatimonadaceae bacterium]|nr:hypothetical protein [Gemmatimonadaceae bacterium]
MRHVLTALFAPVSVVMRTTAAMCAALVALAGCGSDGSGPTAGPDFPATGSLTVTISGLPDGSAAAVTVTGQGIARTLNAAETLTSLSPGSYVVSAGRVMQGTAAYDADAPEQTVVVAAGATPATIAVRYAIRTGALSVVLSGLPAGVEGNVTVTGPNGYATTIRASTTLTALLPGTYNVVAAAVSGAGHTYAPAVPSGPVAVLAAASPAGAAVAYAVTTGAIDVAISGLPDGASASATLAGPGGYVKALTGSVVITNLTPGAYSVSAASVTVGSDTWSVPGGALSLVVSASATPVAATLSYSLATGRLEIGASGLPSGATPTFTVKGPDGSTRTSSPGQTLTGLAPGTYTVTGPSVTLGASVYAPSVPIQSVPVAASTSAAQATFVYAIASGALSVPISGLPQSLSATVTVTGPAGYTKVLSASTSLPGVLAGTYTIVATNAVAGSNIYAPSPPSQTVTVTPGATTTATTIAYALASGSISLSINGLPGASANVVVTGPGGYSRVATTTGLILGLTPGSYTITASSVTLQSVTYAPNPSVQTVNVPASLAAVPVTVTYSPASGSLTLTVLNLPAGVGANVSIAGPGGYVQHPTASQTYSGLPSGSYTITAQPVTNGPTTYTPLPLTQTIAVVAGATASAAVTYSAMGGGFNLTIDGAYITQSVQAYSGSVPLIANRDGLLRVFVRASQTNTATPAVRARFYSGATLISTIDMSPTVPSVPTTIDEAQMSKSWNATVPLSVLQPGVSMLVDVDPANAIVESAESDNAFPASGTPLALDVRAVSPFQIRLVPVTQSANGLTGNVSAANKDQFLALLSKLYPVSAVDIDVRSPFTTSAPALDAGNSNGAWTSVLSEINALRTADGSTRYYYGVVKTSYSSGVAGMGYVPGRAAIGWDNLPSGATVLTHEVGHNFGRFHAPCGGPSGVDGSYPYAGGAIGVYGYDIPMASIKVPTQPDVMSYCSNVWVSDYTYKAILSYRQANPLVAAGAARPGLLVWGSIVNGQTVLEPTFEIVAPPSLPRAAGRHRLELAGDDGRTLVSLSFDGERVADAPIDAETFAFVVPLDLLRGQPLARVRVSRDRRAHEVREPSPLRRPLVRDPGDLPRVSRISKGVASISWSDPNIHGVLVRDARTGDILSFARGRSARVATDANELELTISNGVRSEHHRVSVR